MTEEVTTPEQMLTAAAMLVASALVDPADMVMSSKGPAYVTVEREWLVMLALDIEAIQPGFVDEVRDSLDRLSRSSLPNSGVYFIQAGDAVKIGTSKDISARFRTLRTMSPIPLKLLGTIPGGRDEEAQLHREWAGQRLHGEWFKSTPNLLGHIEGLCIKARLASGETT